MKTFLKKKTKKKKLNVTKVVTLVLKQLFPRMAKTPPQLLTETKNSQALLSGHPCTADLRLFPIRFVSRHFFVFCDLPVVVSLCLRVWQSSVLRMAHDWIETVIERLDLLMYVFWWRCDCLDSDYIQAIDTAIAISF